MTDRLELTVADLDPGDAYATMTTCFIPRPIAWVSTVSIDGVDNLAPHSFTTVAGVSPLTVCFVSVGAKDSLRNVRQTGEFVLHIGGQQQSAVINDSSTALDGTVSEFDAAGIDREPSAAVRPPRVAGAPVALECRAAGEHTIGDSTVVFGEVVVIAIDRTVLADDGKPDPRAIAPVSRLGRNQWARLGEVFELDRIDPGDWASGRRTDAPSFTDGG
jgi:flavin reductase (DIM6/NTAB) family NADH-FMN oxidoreductase RutF